MKEYKIPLENVVRHYDASRKVCPESMSKNDWSIWKGFYDLTNSILNWLQSGGNALEIENAIWEVFRHFSEKYYSDSEDIKVEDSETNGDFEQSLKNEDEQDLEE